MKHFPECCHSIASPRVHCRDELLPGDVIACSCLADHLSRGQVSRIELARHEDGPELLQLLQLLHEVRVLLLDHRQSRKLLSGQAHRRLNRLSLRLTLTLLLRLKLLLLLLLRCKKARLLLLLLLQCCESLLLLDALLLLGDLCLTLRLKLCLVALQRQRLLLCLQRWLLVLLLRQCLLLLCKRLRLPEPMDVKQLCVQQRGLGRCGCRHRCGCCWGSSRQRGRL